MEFTEAVGSLDDFSRFDVDGFTGSALIMDDTIDLTFKTGGYRNNESAITHDRRGILIDDAGSDGSVEHTMHGALHRALHTLHRPAYIVEGRRGIILHLAKLINDARDGTDEEREIGERCHCVREVGELREVRLLSASIIEESTDFCERREHLQKMEEPGSAHKRMKSAYLIEIRDNIVRAKTRER